MNNDYTNWMIRKHKRRLKAHFNIPFFSWSNVSSVMYQFAGGIEILFCNMKQHVYSFTLLLYIHHLT